LNSFDNYEQYHYNIRLFKNIRSAYSASAYAALAYSGLWAVMTEMKMHIEIDNKQHHLK